MRVSIVQNEIKWGYKADNIASFDALVKTLYHNTDLVVLPEMFSTGFAVNDPQLSENEGGEAYSKVKQWANEGNFAVVGSIMTKDSDKYFNRSFFCYPDGTMLTADKRHLFIGDEKRYFTAGNKILTANYKDINIRVLVCYDLRFPVWNRYTEENPFELLVYTANWPKDRIDVWDTLLKARAIENQAFVCAANAIGRDAYKVYHNGHSCVRDVRGELILNFDDDQIAAKTVELDLAFQRKIRERFPVLNDMDEFHINVE